MYLHEILFAIIYPIMEYCAIYREEVINTIKLIMEA